MNPFSFYSSDTQTEPPHTHKVTDSIGIHPCTHRLAAPAWDYQGTSIASGAGAVSCSSIVVQRNKDAGVLMPYQTIDDVPVLLPASSRLTDCPPACHQRSLTLPYQIMSADFYLPVYKAIPCETGMMQDARKRRQRCHDGPCLLINFIHRKFDSIIAPLQNNGS